MLGRPWSRKILIALFAGALLATPAILAEGPEKAETKPRKKEKKPAAGPAEAAKPPVPAPLATPAPPARPVPACEPQSRFDFSTLEDFFGDTGGRFTPEAPGTARPAAATKPAVEWKFVPKPATQEKESEDKTARQAVGLKDPG